MTRATLKNFRLPVTDSTFGRFTNTGATLH